MNIRIYQIDMNKDDHHVAFENLEGMKKFSRRDTVDPSIYESVYEGSLNCKNLEDVYEKFNLDSPPEFRGHSLSVSDVVEVVGGNGEAEAKPGFYFCDSFGFKEVEFDASLTSKREDLMQVVLLVPGEEARIVEIGSDLRDMQHVVRGYIEAFEPFDDKVCVICNEEGVIYDLPPNRVIFEDVFSENTTILGNCFICGVRGDSFVSLTDRQAAHYCEMFRTPPEFEQKWDGTWEMKTSLDQKIASAELQKNAPATKEADLAVGRNDR